MEWCGPHSESRFWIIIEDAGEIKSQQVRDLMLAWESPRMWISWVLKVSKQNNGIFSEDGARL